VNTALAERSDKSACAEVQTGGGCKLAERCCEKALPEVPAKYTASGVALTLRRFDTHCTFLRGLTFELTGPRRQAA
jgi:hypothetical protein